MSERTSRALGPSRSRGRKFLRPLAIIAAALGLVTLTVQPANALLLGTGTVTTAWAPAGSARIHPGVQTETAGGQCTANFIFQNGAEVFIGQAAHCASTGGATDTNGCIAGSRDLGTPVRVGGASQPGTLVYSSWLAMQEAGETDEETCRYNDFALVKIHPDDVVRVNPSVPHWGGPEALGGATSPLEEVYSYGNSPLRQGLTVLSPKTGVSLGTTPGGWSHSVYTLTPGIPGDSGSAFLDSEGRAMGSLSTLALAPPASNGVSDLAHVLAYANDYGFAAELVLGTERFSPGLPIGGLSLGDLGL